jgi:hypothetical protein
VTERGPDVEIAAAVTADELRFECRPKVEIVPYANVPVTVEHESERENLPDEVEEGVTYRDVAVRWRVALRIRSEDQLERPPT